MLKQDGATAAVPETLESSLQLSAFVLQAVGITEGTVIRMIQVERDSHLASREEKAKS